ncbi:MAG: DsbA family oxidoreductase [Thermomicrobiales bacterium]
MGSSTATRTITVKLFEDFICPWCRIGRANLAQALRRWTGVPVDVRHRPYLLDPGIPPEGNDYHAYLEYTLGGNANQVNDAVIAAGKRAGVEFDFSAMRYIPNTLAAHMLVEIAPESAREAIVSDLYDGYFVHMRNIGSIDVLAEIGMRHGMKEPLIRAIDASHPARLQVVESIREAHTLGISGVPFFIVGDAYGVSGAQPADSLLQVLGMVSDEETGNGQ